MVYALRKNRPPTQFFQSAPFRAERRRMNNVRTPTTNEQLGEIRQLIQGFAGEFRNANRHQANQAINQEARLRHLQNIEVQNQRAIGQNNERLGELFQRLQRNERNGNVLTAEMARLEQVVNRNTQRINEQERRMMELSNRWPEISLNEETFQL